MLRQFIHIGEKYPTDLKNISPGSKILSQEPKKYSQRHPKVPPEGLRRPNFPPPGPLRNPSRSRKRPKPEKVDYSRALLPKKHKKLAHWGLWPQPRVDPPERYYKEIFSQLRLPHAGHPVGVGGFQGPAAHCRRPQETSGEKERTRAGEDGQRLRVIGVDSD